METAVQTDRIKMEVIKEDSHCLLKPPMPPVKPPKKQGK